MCAFHVVTDLLKNQYLLIRKGNSIVEEMQLYLAYNISALKPAIRLGACWFNGGIKLSSGPAVQTSLSQIKQNSQHLMGHNNPSDFLHN